MMTFAVVLLSLAFLGMLTHFAPALRSGRTGYPSNRPVRRTRGPVDTPVTLAGFRGTSAQAVPSATEIPQRACA